MTTRRSFAAALTVVSMALAACSGAATMTAAPPSSPGAATVVPSTAVPSGSAVAPSATASGPSSAPSTGGTTAASGLLTAADVEQATGLTGLKAIAKGSVTGAGGDVNYAKADGKLVLMASFFDGAAFDQMKATDDYGEALSGLGDAAFVGPLKGMMPMYFMVGFRKGDHSALLVTFLVGSTSTVLTLDQFKALAAVVASRW
jgi:hypothetical protein